MEQQFQEIAIGDNVNVNSLPWSILCKKKNHYLMAKGTVFSVKWRNEVKKITEKIVQINLSWDAYSGNATLIYLVSIKEYH